MPFTEETTVVVRAIGAAVHAMRDVIYKPASDASEGDIEEQLSELDGEAYGRYQAYSNVLAVLEGRIP